MSDLKALIKQGEGISVEFKLGSGVRKLMKYGKVYGGSDPELVEGDIFRIIVKCPDFETRQTDPTRDILK
jgi:hypothetical protein